MLRGLLAKFGRQAAAPDAKNAARAAADGRHDATAAELSAQGVRQRLRGEYADAQRSLVRAIELEHDCAEAHHNLGLVYLDQGHAEDAVDCLHLAIHFSPRLAPAYASLGAALLALRRYEAAEAACRQALALEPASAVTWLHLGNVLKARGELAPATAAYRAALERDAANADAACQLAFVLFRLGQYAESYQAYAMLLAGQPDFAEAHHNLGLLQLETGYPAEALQSFQRALTLKPGTLETRTCIAHALRDLGQLDAAIQAYDAVLAQRPQFGDAVINRCYALLMRGDYVAGWAAYEQRFAATETPLRDFGVPAWRGEPLRETCVLVFAEQGLGDEIMFASCVPDLLAVAGHCVIECNPRLAGLFARSFTPATVRGADKNEDRDWVSALPQLDYQTPIGSLPAHFRRARVDFPARGGYLMADPARIEGWRRILDTPGKPVRIGIAWRGGTLRNRQLLRSTQLADWIPVIGQREFEFVSLQYGDCKAELLELRDRHHVAVREAGDAASNLDELAAVISALDLVISVDNTVAHLAGALGQPLWVLLPFSAEWRYPHSGNATPWYPSARLFRQVQPRDWIPVMQQVAHSLRTDFAACSTA